MAILYTILCSASLGIVASLSAGTTQGLRLDILAPRLRFIIFTHIIPEQVYRPKPFLTHTAYRSLRDDSLDF